jgi:hypothetical protein
MGPNYEHYLFLLPVYEQELPETKWGIKPNTLRSQLSYAPILWILHNFACFCSLQPRPVSSVAAGTYRLISGLLYASLALPAELRPRMIKKTVNRCIKRAVLPQHYVL